jgi:hypothetical protein
MMLARAIDEDPDNQEDDQPEDNSSNSEKVKHTKVEREPIRNIVNIINPFMLRQVPRYRTEFQLEKVPLFSNNNISRLIEHFFNWLTNKKYLCFKVKINDGFNFDRL